MKTGWTILPVCPMILLAACGVPPSRPVTATAAAKAAFAPSTALQALIDRKLDPGDALLIGAGDIAECESQPVPLHAQETATLIKLFPSATVFAAGDNAYLNATKTEFETCYGTSWGDFKERTRPAPGNHEYGIYMAPRPNRNNATPYFNYFGANAGPPNRGYYSYDLGSWHIVSLNSMAGKTGATTKAAQEKWLKDDLDKNERPCTLAYWHHPLFSSGDQHGDQPKDPGRFTDSLWKILLDHKADVILNGHDHHYEWFDLQDASQTPMPTGIREIIVGTGGGEERGIGTVKPNSRQQLAGVYGVLLMTLHANSYEWHFIQADGTVPDKSPGVTECH
jgi:acid phosphatase type 7